MSYAKQISRAFTLVELLVVISIVALLIALMIPSLTEAREMARASVCMSQERQIAIGFAGYLSDWKFTYPYINPARPYPGPPADRSQYINNWSEVYTMPWTRNLGPYLGNYVKGDLPKVLLCPANLWPAFVINGQGNPPTSYGINDGVIAPNWHDEGVSATNYQPTREKDLKRPSGSLLMGEVPLAASAYGRTFSNIKVSYLPFYADGTYTLPNPVGYWYTPEIAGRPGGNPIARVNHKIAWNSLMCDGSSKRTTKETLLKYGNYWSYISLGAEASMYWYNRFP